MKVFIATVLGLVLTMAASTGWAVVVVLDTSIQCSAGNASNGIDVSDVSGNLGGATECWGTLNGNDPGPSGDGFEYGGAYFDFVVKQEDNTIEGADIGLTITPPDSSARSGTWEYDPQLFSPEAFLIVLKAANRPGFGVWLFDGADAASYSGDWHVAWNRDLSHITIYATVFQPPRQASEPAPIALLALGGLMLGWMRQAARRASGR